MHFFFPGKYLHKSHLRLVVQRYVSITFKASEIPAFNGGIMMVITLLVFGGRKAKPMFLILVFS